MESNIESVAFLDVCLFKGNGWAKTGILDSRVHLKPENTLAMVHYDSAHKRSVFKGIVIGQLTRYARLSSSLDDFNKSAYKLRDALAARGYSAFLLRTQITAVRNRFFDNEREYTLPCESPKCTLCHYIGLPPLWLLNRQPPGWTKGTNCNSQWVVYLIWCDRCTKVFYVGQARELRERILNHLSCIRRGSETPVAEHFNTHPDIPMTESLRFTVLDRVHVSPLTSTEALVAKLLALEEKWIAKTQAARDGLNVDGQPDMPIPFTGPVSRISELIIDKIKLLTHIWDGPFTQIQMSSRCEFPRTVHAPTISRKLGSYIVRSQLEDTNSP